MNIIDRLLNKYTMYQVVLYGMITLMLWALGMSVIGQLSYSPLSLVGSAVVLFIAGYISHTLLAKAFGSFPSVESWMITTWILFFILKPASNLGEYAALVLAAVLASATKYVLARAGKHIFNPAASSVVILGLLGAGLAFWWVGSAAMLPAVAVVGLAVARKTRRIQIVLLFGLVVLAAAGIMALPSGHALETLRLAVVSSPLLFLATIMLTEPTTLPPTRNLRLVYAGLVGVLYSTHFAFGPIYSSPELALCLGNIFSYIVSTKRGFIMTFKGSEVLGSNVYQFAFTPQRPLGHQPGQYLEWTVPHQKIDGRGNRRYFTIASAPGESDVKLGVRIDPTASSSFKRTLMALPVGSKVWASQLAGDFVLPKTTTQPLIFIAGGIGVTPFRSMVSDMIENSTPRDVHLFYTSITAEGFTYSSLFDQAAALGVKTHYIITGPVVPVDWTGGQGFLTTKMITDAVPNYQGANYYLSGPNAMVTNYVKLLRSLHISQVHIKTDYFPGF